MDGWGQFSARDDFSCCSSLGCVVRQGNPGMEAELSPVLALLQVTHLHFSFTCSFSLWLLQL